MSKIVVASDSFKGCLSSRQVADCVAEAVKSIIPECDVLTLSVADGGEGTVEAIVEGLHGTICEAVVSDPLGRPVTASFGVAGDLAIIESASACGLTLLKTEERNPMLATSKGLGELILAAIGQGCRRFLIGLGGTATNDGGRGMIETDSFLEKASGLEFTVACDVDTPFIGPDGASHVFAPQKGATPQMVEELEARMVEYSQKIFKDTGIDVSRMPGAGAAGGLGGAFFAYLGAELKSGADIVLDCLDFDSKAEGADLIITGEGRSDSQTVKGKLPSKILKRAQSMGIPVALVSGAVKDEPMLREAGFQTIEKVTPEDMDLSVAMLPEIATSNLRNVITGLFSHKAPQK